MCKKGENEMARSRGVLTIVQYEKHPITGEILITEDVIIGGLKGLKGVKKSCYIYHSEDTFKESDVKHTKERLKKYYIDHQNEFLNEDGTVSISMDNYVKEKMETDYAFVKVGEKKPPHYHIVILPKNDLDMDVIASIFGVPNHMVESNKNRKDGSTWYECVKYLTHKTTNAIKENKFPYPNNEVVCFGFDYEEELKEYERMMEKYGKALTQEEEYFLQVLHGEKSPLDIQKEDDVFYMKNYEKLRKLQCEYLRNLPIPPFRLNIYVEGDGGFGKGQFTKYLAKNISSDGEYFKVGGKNVTFEGYKGEEVIVWNDFRGEELLKVFGGEEGKVLDYLDPFPDEECDQKQHIKFDYVNLVNRVNIFNSVQPFEEFLSDLVKGNREEGIISQSYRRLPVIIRIHQEDYDILMNTGFLNNTREFLQYEQYNHVRANFAKIANVCKNNKELKEKIMGKALLPVIDQIGVLEEKVSSQELEDVEIEKMFEDVGTFDIDKIKKDNLSKEEREHILEVEKEKELEEIRKRKEEIFEEQFKQKLATLSMEEIEKMRKEGKQSLDEMFSV